MIRYELKDKERQAALEKALPGFKETLRYPETMGQMLEFSHWGSSADWEDDDWSLTINRNQLNEVVAYDPCAWNNYPEVTPPEGVLMRIEGQYAKRPELEYYGALVYLEGAWHFADTSEIADNVIVERFRPWDEEAAK